MISARIQSGRARFFMKDERFMLEMDNYSVVSSNQLFGDAYM